MSLLSKLEQFSGELLARSESLSDSQYSIGREHTELFQKFIEFGFRCIIESSAIEISSAAI
jgi:hypothetical protein